MNTASFLNFFALVATCFVGGCSNVDDRPAAWGYISPAIFQPACATTSCHGPASAVSGLDFSTPDRGYSSLTRLWVWVVSSDGGLAGEACGTVNGTHVCEQKVRPLITPYDPQGSRVVNMLRARDAPRMPPDRPLPEADIRLVERWILNGACRSGIACAGDGAIVDLDAASDATDTDAAHADAVGEAAAGDAGDAVDAGGAGGAGGAGDAGDAGGDRPALDGALNQGSN